MRTTVLFPRPVSGMARWLLVQTQRAQLRGHRELFLTFKRMRTPYSLPFLDRRQLCMRETHRVQQSNFLGC